MSRLPGILLLSALFLSGCAGLDNQVRDETIYIGGSRMRLTINHAVAAFGQTSRQGGRQRLLTGMAMASPATVRSRSVSANNAPYFYKGGKTGRRFHRCFHPDGKGSIPRLEVFQIIQKDKDHVSSRALATTWMPMGNIIKKQIDTEKDPRPKGARYDGARMPFFMRIVGGTGMHEGFLPGYPASHGCIRMPASMAEKFFDNVTLGTPVTVTTANDCQD